MTGLAALSGVAAGAAVYFWWFFGYGFYFSQSRGRLQM